jgi:NDP-sugar pyrophosphorylase family protein
LKTIILAAGSGTRLIPLTENIPKCLVEVGEIPILVNTLNCLNKNCIEECVIVVGHHAEKVMECIGDEFEDIKITYVENKIFNTTGNMYSLWLAKLYLNDDVLLIEGDIFFEDAVIKKICEDPHPDAIAVVDYKDFMDGTVVTANNGVATAMILKKDQGGNFQHDDKLKTVNIYKLSRRFMENYFIPTLNSYIESGHSDEFYELVISKIIRSMQTEISVLRVDDLKWFEIDTYEDLKRAEKLFAD